MKNNNYYKLTGSFDLAADVTGWDKEYGGTTPETHTNFTYSGNTVQ